MRNNTLYELNVYEEKKMVFRFRDSLHLLPGSLLSLGKSLCPELGSKGTLDHQSLDQFNLAQNKEELIEYIRQDIRLLGGIMQKAQKLCWEHYSVDIVSTITCSSLALTIFRTKYYNEEDFPIHLPSQNEEKFIRRGYYGGHTDVYKHRGENLYYYDVNSLYPFVMKEYPMPGGTPRWVNNMILKDLDELFGFIEAYVECPASIDKPFLPRRDEDNILTFKGGEWTGVYYSEELKHAVKLGYSVIPICGYIFEKKESPFIGYVSSLFNNRLQAKKDGNNAMSFVYKLLIHSLYGPKCYR